MKKLNGFQVYGQGEKINDVQIQYSCGKEGALKYYNSYTKRKKGYGKPKHSFKSLLRVFTYLKDDKYRLLFILFITLLSIIISLIGAFISAPLVDSILQPASYSYSGNWSIYSSYLGYKQQVIDNQNFLYQYLFNSIDWVNNPINDAIKLIVILVSIMIGLYIIALILSIIQAKGMVKVGTNALQRLRNDMFRKLQNLPLRYFDTTLHGDIMSRFTNDVDNISMLLINGLLEIFTSLIMAIGIVIFIFFLNWVLALVAIFIEIVGIIIVINNVKRSVNAFSQTQITMGEFNGLSEEVLSGLKVVKCFSKEDDMNKIFKSIDYRHTLDNYKSVYLSSINIPIVNNINNIATAIIALIGVILLVSNTKIPGFIMTIGSLISFISFLRMFSRPFNSISNLMTMVQASLAGAERIFEMIDQKPESALNSAKWHSYKNSEDNKYYWTDGNQTKPVLGEVRFEHVYFSYIKGQTVLKDIDLYAKPGQKIALVGSTGAGKTTITNMITRFYDIDSGKITIDGIDIREIDRVSMRKCMTLVLQDTHLFTGTIYDNIRFGKNHASNQKCIDAAKIACADQFIVKLENGYETVISGNREELSQGQKQLLAIARAAINNPPIIILDEATSSVDTRTESLISKGLENITKNRTTFVIAHRLSTIKDASCIMVMDHGQIIERGTHEQLLSKKGYYYQLWTGKIELD